MIGAVISADMDLIGQLLPNSATRFIRVTMDEALRARKDRENLLNKIRKYLE
jgi:allophanate hydrolase subunit 2|tara:strand:+ start:882 stop:1037 length:156 start_codon:yes stop_codon:yes gene_type:complete